MADRIRFGITQKVYLGNYNSIAVDVGVEFDRGPNESLEKAFDRAEEIVHARLDKKLDEIDQDLGGNKDKPVTEEELVTNESEDKGGLKPVYCIGYPDGNMTHGPEEELKNLMGVTPEKGATIYRFNQETDTMVPLYLERNNHWADLDDDIPF